MSVLCVSYDLRKPGRNYDGLYEALRKWDRCRALDSLWFLDTADGAATVRDILSKEIDEDDQLYVIQLHQHWAAHKTDGCTKWLNKAERSWV